MHKHLTCGYCGITGRACKWRGITSNSTRSFP